MSSIVLELQRECINQAVPIGDVLRKALVIAKKLNIPAFSEWVEFELFGYKDQSQLPSYRVVPATVEVFNPYHGWQPVLFESAAEGRRFTTSPIVESAPQLEDLSKHDGMLHHTFGPETTVGLMRGMELGLPPTRRIGAAALKGIIDAVRTEILQWCLKLEKDGVLGEGMTFSEQERTAAQGDQYTTTHFHIANMTQSQIQHGTSGSSQLISLNTIAADAVRDVLGKLHENLNAIKLDERDRSQIDAQAAAIEAQLKAPLPNDGVIREAFKSIRNVLEGATGSLLASGLIYEVGRLLG